ncbi:MAG: Tim44 domain-containing protein [Betaproteobacteria bacterium]|nr:Tim44 domain-containing protein [Betaproteobacteria bacterium]
MKRTILMLAAVCSAALLMIPEAEARRLGGGRSFGAPRDAVTQRQATPPASAAPAQAAAPASAAAAAKAPGAAAAAPQPAWKRWMGPIAGIAAGLGIAALMSHLGLSEAFGNFLLIALLVIAAIVLFRLFFRRPAPKAESRGMQYAGAGAGAGAGGGQLPAGSGTPTPMFGGGSRGAAQPDAAAKYPPGFEPEPFLRQAKLNFAELQAAYDKADSSTLRDVMTPEMFAEVGNDLAARATHQPTEIVTLAAEIVEVTTENDSHWASVRFTGLLREDGAETAQPFDEVWNLKKPVSGDTGWLLAGIQQQQ